ncbi:MAG: hypothetical protein COT89_03170 [Candidatus Colwellbacteria bacterium CG10_big_fil_rev_8_21_14_0_10_42_22]|uniref:Uncharacterized protein n=1 Tax=Candidatus Colwellbacteria bacterium CG10_big_fil_rev_8_21_14_0_10_42_22 TaxID=1974540 RepID=A0A2H0VHI9_9BACT|nr:MAG: hypothetical protein COT89_03170 [Candidatus Colwellbacteria bacterium CG10_big_fil_rev_8_21_14_0_10_42_22]
MAFDTTRFTEESILETADIYRRIEALQQESANRHTDELKLHSGGFGDSPDLQELIHFVIKTLEGNGLEPSFEMVMMILWERGLYKGTFRSAYSRMLDQGLLGTHGDCILHIPILEEVRR